MGVSEREETLATRSETEYVPNHLREQTVKYHQNIHWDKSDIKCAQLMITERGQAGPDGSMIRCVGPIEARVRGGRGRHCGARQSRPPTPA